MSILFVGVACDLTAFSTLVVLWSVFSGLGPRFDELVQMPLQYFVQNYREAAGWATALVIIANLIAFTAATSRVRQTVRRISGGRNIEAQESAWWKLFHELPGASVYVGCFLEDGSYLRGRLHTYSRVSKESSDRELTLRSDPDQGIAYRAPGTTELQELENVGAVTVSARRLLLLTVTYIESIPVGNEPCVD